MTELQWNQIADTMKQYERTNNTTLDATKPIVIRLDMRAGGSFVRGLEKPWDNAFTQAMSATAQKLAEQFKVHNLRMLVLMKSHSYYLTIVRKNTSHHFLMGNFKKLFLLLLLWQQPNSTKNGWG